MFLLLVLGDCIGYASLIGMSAIPLLLLPGLAYRMRVEERLLSMQFGEQYRAYSRCTKRLIPYNW